MNNGVLRLSMWSGPRNISTAMMRAWGNRADTIVYDEPFYAHYLQATAKPHPGAVEVIAAGPTDADEVVRRLLAPMPRSKTVFYHKQMSHHLLPEMDRQWMRGVAHAFLIREPREVITSYIRHIAEPTLADTGYPQQVEIFELVRGWTGKIPPIVDARDVLNNPRAVLSALCRALGISFSESMLAWPPGPRDTDGVWAKYWYKEVEATTSFQPYRPKDESVPARLNGLLKKCEEYYGQLYEYRLTA